MNVQSLVALEAGLSEPPTREHRPALPDLSANVVARVSHPVAQGPSLANSGPNVAIAGPGFSEKVAFAGLADSAVAASVRPSVEPPDPWIAAGPNHIVQAVNDVLRFSTRAGAKLADVPMATFFLEPGTEQGDSDPRVVYDAGHQRWLASEVSWDCSAGHVRIAVSGTSDPTAGWLVWDFAFAGLLPDYPGLGSSSDKIVFTTNIFSGTCSPGPLVRASIYAIDWAAVLAGGSITATGLTPVVGAFTWRAAANLTSEAPIHLVARGPANEVLYGEIIGTNAGANLAITTTDLTTAGTVPAFADPPQPRDPYGPFGPQAVDARPTDAVWQANHLWFVSTYPYSCDGGVTFQDTVRLTQLGTSGTLTKEQDFLIGQCGVDAWMGGIGLSQDGSLFATYTESNASTYASLFASFRAPLSPLNQMDGSRLLAAGQAGYKGVRWGDYVGVATDPLDPQAVWQAGEYANANGSWSTRVSMLAAYEVPDAPGAVTGVPHNASVQVQWTAPIWDGGTPITDYAATANPSGNTCTTTGTTCTVTGLTNGTAYIFAVTATNGVGTGPASSPSAAVVPRTVPGAPMAASALSRNASALVAWSAPSSNGGATITSYTAISAPGLKTCTTSGLSCTVPGLTNGVAYTFTVKATNVAGSGPASSPTTSVVPAPRVTRLSGPDRFATAAAISAATFAPGADVAYIANAFNFPDALAGAAAAGTIKGPVLLAAIGLPLNPATIAELTRLQPKRIVVLGGPGVISNAVKAALEAYTGP